MSLQKYLSDELHKTRLPGKINLWLSVAEVRHLGELLEAAKPVAPEVAPAAVPRSPANRLLDIHAELVALNHRDAVFGPHQKDGHCGYCLAVRAIDDIGRLAAMLPAGEAKA